MTAQVGGYPAGSKPTAEMKPPPPAISKSATGDGLCRWMLHATVNTSTMLGNAGISIGVAVRCTLPPHDDGNHLGESPAGSFKFIYAG